MFDLFQQEFALFLASCISQRNESLPLFEYIITRINHERSWKVLFDRASISISCSYKRFETTSILCSHALKVFEANDIKVVPEKYILKRWQQKVVVALYMILGEERLKRILDFLSQGGIDIWHLNWLGDIWCISF